MAPVVWPFIFLSSFWLIVNVLARSLRRTPPAKGHPESALLPTVRGSVSRPWWSDVGFCWFVVHTTSFNASPASLIKRVDLRRFYATGSWLVCVLQPTAVLALIFLALKQGAALLSRPAVGSELGERGLEARESAAGGIQAVIPGITIPFSEAPLMLLGLLGAAIVHEAGHAVAAAYEHISPDSIGVFLALAFPGAFVSLAAAPLEMLAPAGKLRIWTAGILHNLVLAFGLLVICNRGLGTMQLVQRLTLWQDQSEAGVVVQNVQPHFSLKPFLTPGTVITQLDDYDLHDSDEINHWTDFLKEKNVDRFASMGWCLGRKAFEEESDACCNDPSRAIDAISHICFSSQIGSHCLPPFQLMSATPANPRCVDLCPGDDTFCLTPDPRAQLLRLTIIPLGAVDPGQILYRGSKEALLRNVVVGRLAPRFVFAPASMPYHSERLLQHTISASLALAAFNLLPIRRLDGEAILGALLEGESLPRWMSSLILRIRSTLEMCCAVCAAWIVGLAMARAVL